MKINGSLKVLFLLNSIFVFASSLLGPLYAVYVNKIDSKIISVSFSWAVFMFSSTLFTYFVGKFGDRVKEQEYLLAGGFLVRCLAWLGYIFVSDITGLILVQFVLGLGESLGTPAWNAIFAKHLDNSKEVMEYSNWNIINNLMVAAATVAGGVVVTYLGFNILFVIMSVLALVSLIGVLITPRKIL
ncbi:MAG TPA: MFS transporter [Candidatus Woesebacteria bacterium]|nr:MFS transporter [Candidatus Woesebacteria bacterium]HPJ16667.1 MFS transporter [Candidatus Woesebacteria bacterium]